MNHLCFICKVYYIIKKVFSLGSCSVLNILQFSFDKLVKFLSFKVKTLLTCITTFCSHKIEYLTVLEETLWKKNITKNIFFFCKLIFLLANEEYFYCQFDEVSKTITLITFLFLFVSSLHLFFFIYYFQELNRQSNNGSSLIKNAVF